MAPEEKTGSCPHQSKIKASLLTINRNDKKKCVRVVSRTSPSYSLRKKGERV
ncbi:MAG: hypothetical protein MJE68_27010 [Proteobacteria bacterium]|nr:hypothetical protein [Pseudomonadota bacterium]